MATAAAAGSDLTCARALTQSRSKIFSGVDEFQTTQTCVMIRHNDLVEPWMKCRTSTNGKGQVPLRAYGLASVFEATSGLTRWEIIVEKAMLPP